MTKIDECAELLRECAGAYARLMASVLMDNAANDDITSGVLENDRGTGAKCMKWLVENGYASGSGRGGE